MGITLASAIIISVVVVRARKLTSDNERLEKMVQTRTKELVRKKEELEKLSIVATKMNDGVIIADADGKIEWMNNSLEFITGYAPDDFVEEFGENVLNIGFDSAQMALKNRDSLKYDFVYLHGSGDHRWLSCSLTPIFGSSGDMDKIVAMYADVTARKQIETEVEQKNKDITDSIIYAKQIQNAILPDRERLEKHFDESFVLYRPRDIVSGDFYW